MGSRQFINRDQFVKDTFQAQNQVLTSNPKTEIPYSDISKNRVQPNSPINQILNYWFDKFVQNDNVIKRAIEQKNAKIAPDDSLVLDAFKSYNYTSDPVLDYFDSSFKSHIKQYHGDSKDDLTKTINFIGKNSVHLNCDNLILSPLSAQNFTTLSNTVDDSQIPNGNITIQNDIVESFEFETDQDEIVVIVNCYKVKQLDEGTLTAVDIESVVTSGHIPDLTRVPYIMKKWVSGLRELNIYVPTTYTSYHAELDVKRNATIIEVKLNRRHFKIKSILDLLITGQSFPLNIDLERSGGEYKDLILPSIVRTLPISNDKSSPNGNILYRDAKYDYLYFGSYGTDAQAIKIQFLPQT